MDFMEITAAYEQARTAPDVTDRASGIEEADRIGGVAAVRERLQGQGAEECEECGVDIPEARRAAMPNAVRCAPCQEVFEAKGRVWRG